MASSRHLGQRRGVRRLGQLRVAGGQHLGPGRQLDGDVGVRAGRGAAVARHRHGARAEATGLVEGGEDVRRAAAGAEPHHRVARAHADGAHVVTATSVLLIGSDEEKTEAAA